MQQEEGYNRLRNTLLSKVLFSAEELDLILSKFQWKTLKKKEFLVEEESAAKWLAFVAEGILRAYSMDEHGKIHILNFSFNDHWVTDMQSFLRNKKASLMIDAVEETKVLVIGAQDFQGLFDQVPKLERYWRITYENAYMGLQQRYIQHLCMTAEEKFNALSKDKPQWLDRLPLNQIAAYLGITPESVSRIRSKKA